MFGNDNGANIIGKGIVSLGTKKSKEENVLLVKDMAHNLLSVSQICDHGHTCVFDSRGCEIMKRYKKGNFYSNKDPRENLHS